MTFEITLLHLILGYLLVFCLGAVAGIGICSWQESKIVNDITEVLIQKEHIAEAQERSERR